MSEDPGRQQPSEAGAENGPNTIHGSSPESGDPNESDTTQQAGKGGEGTSPAQGTPPISADDQHLGQTQVPPLEDDVGVPEDLEDRTE